jgi:hypothetical protein
MKRIKIILTVILLCPYVCFAQYGEHIVSSIPQGPCEILYQEVENAFKEANSCEQDSDCKAIKLGGPYIEFECYKFVNKRIDEDELVKKLEAYHKKCAKMIDLCTPSPNPKCVNKKCSYAEVDSQNVQCTAEAMHCPDGSYVGRIPPDCHFAKCPE